MKLVLALVSLALTVTAVWLTMRLSNPPAQQGLGLEANPEQPVIEWSAKPVPVAAEVGQSDFERVVRQNLFHPDRVWVDPADVAVAPDGDVTDDEVDDVPEAGDAENFELIAIARVGKRAAAVIKVLPPKPKPAVRTTRGGRRVPTRPPSPPARQSSPAKAEDGKKERDTKAYLVGDAVGETGYELTEVESAEPDRKVTLTHTTSGESIELILDKFDEASKERREAAASEAQKRAEAVAKKQEAAQRQAQAEAQKRTQVEKAAQPQANTPQPPPAPQAGGNGAAATDAAAAAAERAERLERIREQFRQRLEERRKQQQQNGTP